MTQSIENKLLNHDYHYCHDDDNDNHDDDNTWS